MFSQKIVYYFFYFIFFLSVLFTLIAIDRGKRINQKLIKQSGSVEMISNELNNYKDDERTRLKNILNYSNVQLKDLVLLDASGIENRISELISKLDYNILVFRYTELNCNGCVSSELSLIKDVFGIDNSRIVVFTTYSNVLDLIYFKRDNNIKFKVYNILSQPVLKTLDDLDRPYCFVIDVMGQVLFPFVPTKENIGLSNTYYQFIKDFMNAD